MNSIHKVLVGEIKIEDIQSEYQKVLKEAEGNFNDKNVHSMDRRNGAV